MSQEFQVWDIPLCPTVTGKCPMLSKKTVPNPINWNCQMRKHDGVLLGNFIFRSKSQPWKNLSWHWNYPIPGWFMSRQASRFDVKTRLQGKPLSPMPPAGGTFWQCCRKVFGRFSTQDRVWQNCQTRSHLNIWQFRRQSIALKIGFGNLAEPDFHLHQGVVFNNRLSTLWGTKLYIIIRTRVSMLAPWRSRNPGQGASWDPHFSFLMRTQTVRIIC